MRPSILISVLLLVACDEVPIDTTFVLDETLAFHVNETAVLPAPPLAGPNGQTTAGAQGGYIAPRDGATAGAVLQLPAQLPKRAVVQFGDAVLPGDTLRNGRFLLVDRVDGKWRSTGLVGTRISILPERKAVGILSPDTNKWEAYAMPETAGVFVITADGAPPTGQQFYMVELTYY